MASPYDTFNKKMMTGQVALITGGSRGGMLQEIARTYLEHGAKAVILMARQKDKLEGVCRELGKFGTAVAVSGDVRKAEDCKAAVQVATDKFGRLDILINGAAGNFLASADKITTNGFRTVLEIDTLGTFNMSQAAFLGAFKSQKSGTIINITANLYYNGTAL